MAAGDIHRWTSNSSNAWATAGNWDGGVPADSTVAYCDGSGQADIDGSDQGSAILLLANLTTPRPFRHCVVAGSLHR